MFDCPNDVDSIRRLVSIIRSCMEARTRHKFGLVVPLTVNISMGGDWGSLQSYEEELINLND